MHIFRIIIDMSSIEIYALFREMSTISKVSLGVTGTVSPAKDYTNKGGIASHRSTKKETEFIEVLHEKFRGGLVRTMKD